MSRYSRDDPRLPRGETEAFGAYVHRLAVHLGYIGPGHPMHGTKPEAFGQGPTGLAGAIAQLGLAPMPDAVVEPPADREPGEEG